MSKAALTELKQHQHIDAVIMRELRRPDWTVVEAVLLICNIAPPPGCEDIPEVAAQLLDEAKHADEYQLKLAESVLYRWHWKNPDKGPDRSYGDWRRDFINWARRDVSGSDGPQLLEHFYQRMERWPKRLPPLALSAGALERFEQLEEAAVPPARRHGQSRRPGRPSQLTGWLRIAWHDLDERVDRNADTIMAKLAEMLEARNCSPLVSVESDGIVYAQRDRAGRPIGNSLYPYDSLKRWVNRQHEKARVGIRPAYL
jgi:hypothetical protein